MYDSPIRVGGVPYLVGAPLVAGLEDDRRVRLTKAVPSELIDLLRAGRLDAALVSSIEAFREPGYSALPDLGIAADGAVRSVRLFCRDEPARARSLALDRGSESSAALVRILLERRFGARLERVFAIDPTPEPDSVDADAVLLIGDAGLEAKAGSRAVLDLAQEWRAWKRLPFVFALWLVCEHAPRAAAILRDARAASQHVTDGTGGLISYELGDGHRAGLEEFRHEALRLGLCAQGVEPRWLHPARASGPILRSTVPE